MNLSEKQFYNTMKAKGFTLYFEPIRFKTSNSHYTPDFYCDENKTYYEVVGTRQAFHLNKHKYKEIILRGIKFKIVNPDGSNYIKKKKKKQKKKQIKNSPIMLDKEIIRAFKAKLVLRDKRFSQFAKDNKFNPAVFSLAINGHTHLREEYQKAIEDYLK